MTRHVRLRELLIGVEGLALLRRLYDGTDDEAERRIAAVRRILDDEAIVEVGGLGQRVDRGARALGPQRARCHDTSDPVRCVGVRRDAPPW